METKQQIRKRHLLKRNALSEETVRTKSLRISLILQDYFKGLHTDGEISVYGYYPCRNEVSLIPLYEWLLEQKIPLAFPKVSKERMEFYQVRSMQDFKEGAFHIMEPKEEFGPAGFEHAFCLVPGSAFDLSGNRYGYGKGFYDRYLSAHAHLRRIGIAYEGQIEQAIPSESSDVKMQALATETGMIFLEEEPYGIIGNL